MSLLKEKVALILGASTRGGIGEATAKAFAREGAKMMLSARRLDGAAAIARDLGAQAVRCDATQEADIAEAVDATLAAFGKLDIAMIVAGDHANEPFDNIKLETLRRLFEVNVVGPTLFIQRCTRVMQTGSSIIVVSSHSAQLTTVGIGPYGATKAAAERMVEVAALEYAARGIRINTLSPSMVATPMSAPALQNRPGLREGFESETPLGRLATVDEVAAGALWLASDQCFTTGDRIRVGGGIHLRRFPLPAKPG